MNEEQFVSVARKSAADIRSLYILTHNLDYYERNVTIHAELIRKYMIPNKANAYRLFDAYRMYCKNDLYNQSIQHLNFALCAFVVLENLREQKDLIDKVNGINKKIIW